MGYVLDTGMLIDAMHDESRADELRRFYQSNLPATFLHAVVAQEIIAGAESQRRVRALEEEYVEPFLRTGRLVTPTFDAWVRTARAISRMIELRLVGSTFKRSFVNDVLLAVSCRESGHTLVTRNLADFERIQKVVSFHFLPDFPPAFPPFRRLKRPTPLGR